MFRNKFFMLYVLFGNIDYLFVSETINIALFRIPTIFNVIIAGEVQITRLFDRRDDSAIFELNETAQCCGGSLDACNFLAASLAQVLLAINLQANKNLNK